MSYEIPFNKLGIFPANIDLSASQFTAVEIVAASGGVVGAGVGGAALGHPSAGGHILAILQNKPIAGEAAELTAQGVSKALCAGTFAVGAILMVDATGKFLLATTGNRGVAQALETGANGSVSAVYIKDFGIQ